MLEKRKKGPKMKKGHSKLHEIFMPLRQRREKVHTVWNPPKKSPYSYSVGKWDFLKSFSNSVCVCSDIPQIEVNFVGVVDEWASSFSMHCFLNLGSTIFLEYIQLASSFNPHVYLDRKPHFCALQRRDLSSKWENSTSMKLLRREQKSRTVVASVVSYVFRYNNFDTPCYWCSSSDIKSASKFGDCVCVLLFCIIWPRAKYRIVFGCGEFDHCVVTVRKVIIQTCIQGAKVPVSIVFGPLSCKNTYHSANVCIRMYLLPYISIT